MMKTLFSRRAACSEGTALMVVAALLISLIVTKTQRIIHESRTGPFCSGDGYRVLVLGLQSYFESDLLRVLVPMRQRLHSA